MHPESCLVNVLRAKVVWALSWSNVHSMQACTHSSVTSRKPPLYFPTTQTFPTPWRDPEPWGMPSLANFFIPLLGQLREKKTSRKLSSWTLKLALLMQWSANCTFHLFPTLLTLERSSITNWKLIHTSSLVRQSVNFLASHHQVKSHKKRREKRSKVTVYLFSIQGPTGSTFDVNHLHLAAKRWSYSIKCSNGQMVQHTSSTYSELATVDLSVFKSIVHSFHRQAEAWLLE